MRINGLASTPSCIVAGLLLGGCGQAGSGVGVTEPQLGTIDSLSNLAYAPGGEATHRLDLFLPQGKKNEPLLMFIHGGAWIGGDQGMYSAVGRRFADDGVAVATINYRLSPGVQNPEPVKDAAQAYAWLVQNAGKYGYDAKRIFVSGHSAGAHNAAMMATGHFLQDAKVPAGVLPAGFIGLEGIYDIPDLNEKYPTYKDWFFTKAFGAESNWEGASPSRRPLVLQAPWLVIQSTQDPLVDVSQAEKFAEHLAAASVPVELWKKPGGNHDEVMQRLSDPKDPVALEMLAFIGKSG